MENDGNPSNSAKNVGTVACWLTTMAFAPLDPLQETPVEVKHFSTGYPLAIVTVRLVITFLPPATALYDVAVVIA